MKAIPISKAELEELKTHGRFLRAVRAGLTANVYRFSALVEPMRCFCNKADGKVYEALLVAKEDDGATYGIITTLTPLTEDQAAFASAESIDDLQSYMKQQIDRPER